MFQSERKEDFYKAVLEAKRGSDARSPNLVVNWEEAEELKQKEKRQRERERRLRRKKRGRLEAQREEAEDEEDGSDDETKVNDLPSKANGKHSRGGKARRSVVDVAYQRAKALKGEGRARAAGKLSSGENQLVKEKVVPKRKQEMEDLFEADMSSGKRKKSGFGAGGNTRKEGVSKRAFKSKARYKRRK